MKPHDKIGRRRFGKTLAAAGTAMVATEAPAQPPGPTASSDPAVRAARDSQNEGTRAIAQIKLPRDVEPAFRFKP